MSAFLQNWWRLRPLSKKLIYTGVIGAVLAAACCVTPLLPIMLTSVGLTGLLAVLYKDAVLLPAMGIFILIAGYGFWRQQQQKQ